MTYYKKIIGEKCYLSPCSLDDAVNWAAWLNDLAVTIPLGDEAYSQLPLERTREDLRLMLQNNDHVFTIVNLADDQAIGRILLFGLDLVNRSAMVGLFIGEKNLWGQGFGQDALKILLDYGFNLLNLHNIMLGVFAFNQRAIKSYSRIGFKEIGRRREARIIAGKKYDVVFMDILEDEFRLIHGASGISKI